MAAVELRGALAVVTGGGSGIGRALTLGLAAAGSRVVVADIDGDAAAAVAAEAGTGATPCTVDVTDDAAVAALADRTAELGGADLVFANAGVLISAKVTDLGVQDWAWLLGVNVLGTVRTIDALLPQLRAKGRGHVAITGSVTALRGGGAYGATKAALLHLADSLADELAAEGIGVSITLPAQVGTNITSSQRNRPPEFGRHAPEPFAGRTDFGIDPEHVARLALQAVVAGDRYVPVFPDGQQDRYTQPVRDRLQALSDGATKGSVRP